VRGVPSNPHAPKSIAEGFLAPTGHFRNLLFLLASSILAALASAQSSPSTVQIQPILHDGAHDFDPLFGNFTFHLRRLLHPLTGNRDWKELNGTLACYKVWNGRAQLDTLELDGGSGHIEGLTLRLYDPASRQWRLYWANSRIGRFDPPQIGAFRDGRGDFYTTDLINGKTILIRYDWSAMNSGSPHFEQSFSADGGKTWEVNWISDQIRTGDSVWGQPQPGKMSTPPPGTPTPPPSSARDGQHDFDFDFGTWKMHIRRLLHPLTGSTEWTEMDGTTVTNKVWNGRANLATVEANGPTGNLELLAMRLYDPESHQWSIHFATSDVGILSVPAVGQFTNGRGEFYDSELYQGRSILVRFSIWAVSPDSVRSEQAFSADGGKTWETNWINTYERVKNHGGQ
jgi:hypothetical protein